MVFLGFLASQGAQGGPEEAREAQESPGERLGHENEHFLSVICIFFKHFHGNFCSDSVFFYCIS